LTPIIIGFKGVKVTMAKKVPRAKAALIASGLFFPKKFETNAYMHAGM